MKPKRLKSTKNSEEESAAASIARSYLIQGEGEEETPKTGVEISREVLSRFSNDCDLKPRLSDEMTRDQVQFIVDEVAMIIGGSRVTTAHWNAVANFLREELEEFREMKEDFVKAERKLVLVSQRLNEATHPADGVVSKTKIMACAMVYGETEMRRDNLHGRISMIINELSKRIMACIESELNRDELEIRLRGVLGSF